MLNNKKNIIIVITLIIVIVISIIIYMIYLKNSKEDIDFIEDELEENLDEIKAEKLSEKENKEENIIVVHIAGEVNKPGIVKLKENSRIIDAIEQAGGVNNNADLSNVNLAYILSDGQKINIPNKNEKEQKDIITQSAGVEIDSKNNKTMININTATIEELQKLPGVGEAMAKKIITYRTQNGKFKNIEDIKNVSGIGEAKFNNIKDFIIAK